MNGLAFRNVDDDPATDPDEWPFEGVLAAVERGSLTDWRRLAAVIAANPWGPCARAVEDIAGWGENGGLDALFVDLIGAARRRVDDESCRRYGERIRQIRRALGMSQRQFAPLIGTSAQRLSSYENGRVAPSTVVLGRVDRLAQRGSVTPV